MWDLYLLERDPFLILFLALVMILNAKSVTGGPLRHQTLSLSLSLQGAGDGE